MKTVICIIFLGVTGYAGARNYFVAKDGNDSSDGTLENPFFTISRGISKLGPGDTLYLREGTYHEDMLIKDLKGKEGQPIVICPYEKEKVILDGTISLDNLEWKRATGFKNVWQAKIDQDIWQLFVNDRMMINARWPNAEHPFENEERSTWWSREKSWRRVQHKKDGVTVSGFDFERAIGFLTDVEVGDKLADMNRSVVGLMGVLNVNSMTTLAGHISKHKKGTSDFEYEVNEELQSQVRDPEQTNLRRILTKNVSHAWYYFEGWADLIDTPDEWAYDKDTKILSLYAEKAKDLEELRIRGKVQTTAIKLQDCDYISVRGLNFFGTAIQAFDCKHINIENNTFDYPSYSKRMLGSLEATEIITINSKGRLRVRDATEEIEDNNDPSAKHPRFVERKNGTYNVFRNNMVRYTDGSGLHLSDGAYDVVDNNLFLYIDISGTPGGSTGIWTTGWKNRFTHNTIRYCGSSKATKVGDVGTVSLNRVSHFGYLQDDGTAFQSANVGQHGIVMSQNWIHDSPKSGLRFDGPDNVNGYTKKIYNGSMVRNVVFNNNGGLMVKGTDHRVYNNTCYNIANDAYRVLTTPGVEHCNHETVTRNNIGNFINSSRRGDPHKNPPVGPTSNNWVNLSPQRDIREILCDPENLDFRPRDDALELIDNGADIPSELLFCGVTIPDFTTEFKIGKAPDIGAYEFGADNYWIPGYRSSKASTPIPPDGTKTAKTETDLMWLEAYQSKAFRVYFGTSSNIMELVSEQTNNIFDPGKLDPTTQYFWRIDCKTPEGWVKGDTWTFYAKNRPFPRGGALPASYIASFEEVYDFDQANLEHNYRGLLLPWIPPKYNSDHLDITNGNMVITPNSDRTQDFGPITIPKVNINLENYPFCTLTYKTPSRSKELGLYLGYAAPGGTSRYVFPETPAAVLAPSPDEFRTVILRLDEAISLGKTTQNSTIAKDFLIQINGPNDAKWEISDGSLLISNFTLGFACLLNGIENIKIERMRREIASKGQAIIVDSRDFEISVTVKEDHKKYTFPVNELIPEDWTLELGNGDNYNVIAENIISPSNGFKGKLIVPVTIITNKGLRSNTYKLDISVK